MNQAIFFLIFLFSFSVNSQILFSEYAEGTSYNKYLEIYNYSGTTINLDLYGFPSCSNGCDSDGEWDYMNYFPDGAVIEAGDVYVITHPNAANPENEYYTEEIALHSDHQFSYLSNGDDVFALINIDTGDILDVIGAVGPDPGNGWEVAGVTDATKDHTLLRKSYVESGNDGDWSSSAGTNASDSEWVVLENENWDNLGFHDFSGVTNVFGCTDTEALNYNPDATIDDGSCEYVIVEGCADVTACNYDPLADNSLFMYNITDSNMTIAIEASVGMSAGLEAGDVIGVFYVNNNGDLMCGGSVEWSGQSEAIAAWGSESGLDNGFDPGEEFLFVVHKINGGIFYTSSSMNSNPPFSASYIANGFGQVTDLMVTDPFLDEINCEYPELYYDCDGECLNDSDGDGICDEFELSLEDQKYNLAKCTKVMNLLGREVTQNITNNLIFKIFDDGSVQKTIIIK